MVELNHTSLNHSIYINNRITTTGWSTYIINKRGYKTMRLTFKLTLTLPINTKADGQYT